MRLLLLILIPLLSISTLAEEDHPLCNDLAKFACAPGQHNDGTGSAQAFYEQESFDEQIKKDYKERIKKEVRELLTDNSASSKNLKKIALSGFGLTFSGDCQSEDLNRQKICEDNLVEGFTDLLIGHLLTPKEQKNNNWKGNREEDIDPEVAFSDLVLLFKNPIYKKLKKKTYERIEKDLFNKKTYSKIKDTLFPRAKSLFVDEIKLKVKDPAAREKMISKIKATQWDDLRCREENTSDRRISRLFQNNAFYNPAANTLSICNARLNNNSSEFQIMFTLLHEFSHAIDPCTITTGLGKNNDFKYPEGKSYVETQFYYPVPKLLMCLREEQSIGAEHNQIGFHSSSKQYVERKEHWDSFYRESKRMPFDNFCNDDQINEATSDWWAAEILPKYMELYHPQLTKEQSRTGYANARRISCYANPVFQPSYAENFMKHPDSNKRINNLILVNPKIREQMGCKKPHKTNIYCDGFTSFSFDIDNAPQPQEDPIPGEQAPGPYYENKGSAQ